MLDIFNNDAFKVVPLTDAINKLIFVPGYLGSRGLFTPTPIAQTAASIEEKGGILKLIAPTPRGAPGTTIDKGKRKLRMLAVPHFEINDAVMAEEVQGVRPFGQETGLETVQNIVGQRLQVHGQSLQATKEYALIGAIKGIITYADGSTTNLFTEFEVQAEGEIDFSFDTNKGGLLRKFCAGVYRQMAGILDGVPFSGIEALCGDAFFDDLIANEEARATYLNTQAAADLRSNYISGGQVYGSFNFGGIQFTNYRGSVGAQAFIHTDKCHLFPTGVPGLFRSYVSPADYMETVNTLGMEYYAKQYPMPNDKGVNLDVQTNQLHICTRPKSLIKGKRT